MTLFATLFRRLGHSWRWLAAQFLLTPMLLLLGLAWTRIPEKNFLQVALTLLLPLLLAISFLELEAGTLRAFATSNGRRVKLVWGAVGLLAVGLLLWIAWGLCDDVTNHATDWASYLNSQSPAHTRIFTFERYLHAFTVAGWILYWIVTPALLLPVALGVAEAAHRIAWRRVFHLLIDWKWWTGVTLAALLGVLLPSHFFNALPHGTVQAQEWHLSLKLGGAFLLKLASWILILAWLGVLFDRIPETPRSRAAELFCRNLRTGWRWIAAAAALILVINLPVWPLTTIGTVDVVGTLAMGLRIAVSAAIFVLLILFVRSLFPLLENKTRIYWGILAPLVWFGIAFGVSSLNERFPLPVLHLGWGDFVTFVVFPPFVAAAAVLGWMLPWKRILRLFRDPRWLAAAVATFVAETYLSSPIADQFSSPSLSPGVPAHLHDILAMSLSLGFVVLEVSWLVALLAAQEPEVPSEEIPVPVSSSTNHPG